MKRHWHTLTLREVSFLGMTALWAKAILARKGKA